MKNSLMILVLFLFVSVFAHDSRSCPTSCGNVSITYPFGVGRGCYINEDYEVECRNKSVPFLRKINREIVRIDLPRPFQYGDESFPSGSLRIKTHITSVGCSGGRRGGEKFEEILNISGTPFTISGNQKIVAFGCNVKATLTQIEPRLVGCISSCDLDIRRKIPSDHWDKKCNGYGCCSADMAEKAGDVVGVKIESSDGGNTTTTRGCRVAFLTDETNQTWGKITDPKWFHARQYSTIQLEWKVRTTNISFEESLGCGPHAVNDEFHSSPCYCDGVTQNDELSHLWCACTSGYEGNPYLPNGCKDIDECAQSLEDGRPKYCTSGGTCQNLPGGHRCVINKDKTLRIYIGVSIGLGLLLVGISISLYIYIKIIRKRNLRKKNFERNGGLLLEQQLTSREDSVQRIKVFNFEELEKATKSFSSENVLGEGGQGTVFKGILADGRTVAVKKSKVLDEDRVEKFINEFVILSQINHRNIVGILGCCLETEVPILVYEFIPNGNLFQHLHDHQTITTWEARMRIATEIAGALSHLHSAASPQIYHKDIKTANIMLDENYKATLSDFGMSRTIAADHSHLTTVVSGTVGYVDPEYFQSSQYSEKSDVYSYGVVLTELITGEKPVSFQRSPERRLLANYFLLSIEEKTILEIIDPRIRDNCRVEQVTRTAEIAKSCLNLKGEKRPRMREIHIELDKMFSSQRVTEESSKSGLV